jgi:hypothetical protein
MLKRPQDEPPGAVSFVPGLCFPSYSLVTPYVLIEFCGVAALSHGGDKRRPR